MGIYIGGVFTRIDQMVMLQWFVDFNKFFLFRIFFCKTNSQILYKLQVRTSYLHKYSHIEIECSCIFMTLILFLGHRSAEHGLFTQSSCFTKSWENVKFLKLIIVQENFELVCTCLTKTSNIFNSMTMYIYNISNKGTELLDLELKKTILF